MYLQPIGINTDMNTSKMYIDSRMAFTSALGAHRRTQNEMHELVVKTCSEFCMLNDRVLDSFQAMYDVLVKDNSANVESKAFALWFKTHGFVVKKDESLGINVKFHKKNGFEVGSREWLDEIKASPWYKLKEQVKEWKDVSEISWSSAAMQAAKLAYKGEGPTDEEIVAEFRAAQRAAMEKDTFLEWAAEYDVRNPVEDAA